MITFPVGHTFKNYSDACRQLNQPTQQGGRNRKRQEAYWAEHFVFTKVGHKYIICQMLKPFPLKSLPPTPEDKRLSMHIAPLILHELTEALLGRSSLSLYGLCQEFVFPGSEAYLLFGLATPLWKELKYGDAPLDLTSLEQRKAYFEHRATCRDKLRGAIEMLIRRKLIWQDSVIIVKEEIKEIDQPLIYRNRYARTEEESDLRAAEVKAFELLTKKYPDRKKPFTCIADVFLSHREEEYNILLREFIESEVNAKAVIECPVGFRKIVSFFPATRLAFNTDVLKQAFIQLSQAEIYKEQQLIKRKLISWYEVRFERDESTELKCCLYDIVGDIEHE